MRRSTLALLASCGTLASVVFLEVKYYNPYSDGLAPLLPAEKALNELNRPSKDIQWSPPPRSRFSNITERPLFNRSRKKASNSLANYRLQGVFLSSNGNVGLIERRSDGVVSRLSEGSFVDGWEVTSVDPQSIWLSNGEVFYYLYIERMDDNDLSEHTDENETYDEFQEETVTSQLNQYNGNTDEMPLAPKPRMQVADDGYGRAGPTDLPPPPLPPRRRPSGRPTTFELPEDRRPGA